MAPDPKLRSADLPSQKQVIELLDGEFARAGYEIDDVVVDGTVADRGRVAGPAGRG